MNNNNKITAVGGFGHDWGWWLTLLALLIAVGILPKKLKVPVAIATVLYGLL